MTINQKKRRTFRPDKAFKFFNRLGMFNNEHGATIEIANTIPDLREAHKLVHGRFVQKGYLKTRAENGMRIRPAEVVGMTTFIAKDEEGKIVGVQSMARDTPCIGGLPASHVFGNEIDRIRMLGRIASEATNEAIDENYMGTNLAFDLMRAYIAFSKRIGDNSIVTAVSTERAYRLFSFKKIGIGDYSHEGKPDPVYFMHLDTDGFGKAVEEHKRTGGRRGTPQEVYNFFFKENRHRETIEAYERAPPIDPEALIQFYFGNNTEKGKEEGNLEKLCAEKGIDGEAIKQAIRKEYKQKTKQQESRYAASA